MIRSAHLLHRLSTIRSERPRALPTEHQEQCAVIDWWAYARKDYGLPDFALFAIPNAGAGASRGQAGKMKAEGVRAGMPDLCLAVPRPPSHGLYIEMKSRGQNPRPSQREVIDYLKGAGYAVFVCHSYDDAVRTIRAYLA